MLSTIGGRKHVCESHESWDGRLILRVACAEDLTATTSEEQSHGLGVESVWHNRSPVWRLRLSTLKNLARPLVVR